MGGIPAIRNPVAFVLSDEKIEDVYFTSTPSLVNEANMKVRSATKLDKDTLYNFETVCKLVNNTPVEEDSTNVGGDSISSSFNMTYIIIAIVVVAAFTLTFVILKRKNKGA